jgi:transcriptional regulator with XRE-family HTH domain
VASTGDAIKKLRTQLGLTQQQLAEYVGVSQQTIARWEGGADVPTKYLKDLAIVLECSVSDLIEGTAVSYLMRYAERRSRLEELDDSDVPYGTARFVFVRPLGTSAATQGAVEELDDTPDELTHEFPITKGEMRRLRYRFDRREEKWNWFSFETLDNWLVFVNRSELEMFETIGDDVEQLPSYEHEEVYKALSDHEMRSVLDGTTPLETLDDEDSPYSRRLVERCVELLADAGGLGELLDTVSGITVETVDGRRKHLFSDPQEEAYSEVGVLSIQLDNIWDRDSAPADDWLVELGTEGYYRSTHFRLGSLRLIQVPLYEYLQNQEQMLKEITGEEGDDGDGEAAREA